MKQHLIAQQAAKISLSADFSVAATNAAYEATQSAFPGLDLERRYSRKYNPEKHAQQVDAYAFYWAARAAYFMF